MAAIESLTKVQPIAADIIQRAFTKVNWHGRMEEVLSGVFVDGAHNQAGITAFMEAVRGMPQKRKRVLLFSVVKEKELEPMVQILCEKEEFSAVILTEIEGSRKRDLQEIRKAFLRETKAELVCIADMKEAFLKGMEWKGKDGLLFCAGSLYLVGQIKTIVEKMEDFIYD